MSALADCYASLSNPFGVRGPLYGPQGHRGADYRRGAGQAVLAYERCTVVLVEWSRFIGWCVSARLADGRYAGWAHGRPPLVRVGQALNAGDRVFDVAGAADDPGVTWAGAHIHTTLGPSAESIFAGTVFDPAPRIAAALGGSVPAGGGTPAPVTPTTPYTKRSGIMETVVAAPNGVVVHIYPGGKKNFASPGEYNTARDQIAFLRKQGASNLMALPPLASVPKVSWDTFGFLCEYVGAPTA